MANPREPMQEIPVQIENGQWLAIAGGTGSGKSRLLRTLLRSRTGAELVSDSALGTWAARRRVRAWLARASMQRQGEAAHAFGLTALLDRRLGELSTGERARVRLACAWLRQPHTFLLDDPLRALDPESRTRLRGWFIQSVRARQATVVWATGDADEAQCVGDRVAVLGEGRIEACVEARDFYRDPPTRAAARLAGMNFLDGRLDERDGLRLFAFADGDAEGMLPLSHVHDVPEVPGSERGRGSLTLGVRPEGVRVARAAEELGAWRIAEAAKPADAVLPDWAISTFGETVPGAAPGRALGQDWQARLARLEREEALRFAAAGGALRWIARVRRVEISGRETRLELGLGSAVWWANAPGAGAGALPGTASNSDWRAGERVWVELDREALYWFDAQGARLRARFGEEAPEPLPTLALEDEPGTRGLKSSPAASVEADSVRALQALRENRAKE